jgi:hypothetical protein
MRNASPEFFFLTIIFSALFVVTAPAADEFATEMTPAINRSTNDPALAEIQRGFLLLQEQIHDTQLSIERTQQAAQAAIRHTAEDAAARFETLEQSLKSQRTDDIEMMQRANHFMLIAVGIFGAVIFLAMLLTAYFQWWVAGRLASLASVRPTMLTMANSRTLSESGNAPSGDAVQLANERLLGVVERLQKRIAEIEHTVRTN